MLAVRLGPGLLIDPPAAEWLGDAERCIAWAVLAALGWGAS